MHDTDPETQSENLNQLTRQVISLCTQVHRALGPGRPESAYEDALALELTQAGVPFQRHREITLRHQGADLPCGYWIDFLVAEKLIVEIEADSELSAVHQAQLLTELKLAGCPLGLLINFHVPDLKDGIWRVAPGKPIQESKSPTLGLGDPA